MNVPGRLRYVNQLVGTFLIIIVLLALVGVLVVVRSQAIFTGAYPLYAYIEEPQLDGIQRGTDVYILGRVAGQVQTIRYVTEPRADGKNVEIELSIREPYMDEIFVDSIMHVRRRLSGAGEAFLEITRGPLHRVVLSPGGTIADVQFEAGPASEFARITDMMGEIREDFRMTRESMVRAFDALRNTSEEASESNRRLQGVIGDLEEFTPQLSPLAEKSDRVLNDLEDFSPRLDPLALKTDRVLDASQETVDALRAEAQALDGVGEKLNDGLDDANKVIDGLKRHWLLRRYIEPGKGDKMLSPAELGSGGYLP